ncbi:ABC transporter permease [Phaeobacter marinintestinus]|uniref:ABC transporter permease n=1 Tax=Falsiphaeobacter marinintestinus TaxID=1492905 RepID=UPI0011B52797|nr:FtsX-like permease family protein [Phaeobacter marinintestinus]
MSPLTRKLFRDLWRIKAQAVAIAMVIAMGVLMQVMMTGLVTSLDETRQAYYDRYRLADIFAYVTRAPEPIVADLRQIPGVAQVETRIMGSALVDVPGVDAPLQAQAVSLPDFGDPRLNDLYLTDGRKLDGTRPDEILLLKGFGDAHGLQVGDTLAATMNGARRTFDIVGLVQSPEFLYTIAPGEFVSDDSRFAVIWAARSTLAAAYDLDGAFNEALMSITRGTDPAAVMDAADRILDRYGGRGAYGVADLISNRFITEEIGGLSRTSGSVPLVFLAVAAFLLNIVITRMVQSEREEIGLMKAFGYSNWQVGGHYFELILTIAAGGALLGCVLGIAAGRGMVDLYLNYFKFPFLVFRLDPSAFVIGVTASILSASAGGLFVLRKVFALSPAVAMRPAAPPDYSRSGRFGAAAARFMDQPTRMVLRRFTRQPFRMGGSVVGIAAGLALSTAMSSLLANFEYMVDVSFNAIDRSDVTVTFTHPLERRTLFELERIPGVIEVEPVRDVAAILGRGVKTYRGGISGLGVDSRLYRALDANERPVFMRSDGIILSTGLASILGASAGDILTVDVREGRQPVVDLPVVAVSQSLVGAPAYMEIEALNRALGEPLRVSGAYLRIDADQSSQIYNALKDRPNVAGVSLKSDARDALVKLVDEGPGNMRYVMALIAGIITFGVVYNAARIAQAERSRDLASLRVIGFTKAEVGFVLLGEIGIVTLLALPLGSGLGYLLTFVVAAAFSTELYQILPIVNPANYGTAILIVIVASALSAWLVKRDIDRTELVLALKTRE